MNEHKLSDIRQCAKDMAHFLSIGWRKSDLAALEELWWKTLKYRLSPAVPPKEPSDAKPKAKIERIRSWT